VGDDFGDDSLKKAQSTSMTSTFAAEAQELGSSEKIKTS
jgi:hypothetical protein